MVYIQISASTYSGYKYFISNSKFYFMTQEEIIKDIKDDMKKFFKKYDLYLLKKV